MLDALNTTLTQILHQISETREGLTHKIADTRNELRHDLALEISASRQALETRIDTVETKLDIFRNETLGHFAALYRRLDRLETEYHSISAALIRVEEKLSEERSNREELQREVESLKTRLAQLEKKLAELEQELRDSADA